MLGPPCAQGRPGALELAATRHASAARLSQVARAGWRRHGALGWRAASQPRAEVEALAARLEEDLQRRAAPEQQPDATVGRVVAHAGGAGSALGDRYGACGGALQPARRADPHGASVVTVVVVAAATVIAALWRKSSQLDVGLDAKPGALGRQANFINEARDHLRSLGLAQVCRDAACMCSRQAVISTEAETAG